jgi:hypothetical protein
VARVQLVERRARYCPELLYEALHTCLDASQRAPLDLRRWDVEGIFIAEGFIFLLIVTSSADSSCRLKKMYLSNTCPSWLVKAVLPERSAIAVSQWIKKIGLDVRKEKPDVMVDRVSEVCFVECSDYH